MYVPLFPNRSCYVDSSGRGRVVWDRLEADVRHASGVLDAYVTVLMVY